MGTDEASTVGSVVNDVADSPTDDVKDSGPGKGPDQTGDSATAGDPAGRPSEAADEPAPAPAEAADTPADQPEPDSGPAAEEASPEAADSVEATEPVPGATPLPEVEETAFGAVGTAAVPPQTRSGSPDVAEPLDPRTDEWSRQGDWAVSAPPGELVPAQADYHTEPHLDDHADPDDEEWVDEYDDIALFSAIFSAPSLALAAFVFALTGLLGGMIPESLPYLVQLDPSTGPEYHVRIVGLIALGFAIVAASLGLAAMLRSIGSPLRWPRYLGGAAVLLALLIALQSVLLIVLAWLAPAQGGMN